MQLPVKFTTLYTILFRQPIPKDILCKTLEMIQAKILCGDSKKIRSKAMLSRHFVVTLHR